MPSTSLLSISFHGEENRYSDAKRTWSFAIKCEDPALSLAQGRFNGFTRCYIKTNKQAHKPTSYLQQQIINHYATGSFSKFRCETGSTCFSFAHRKWTTLPLGYTHSADSPINFPHTPHRRSLPITRCCDLNLFSWHFVCNGCVSWRRKKKKRKKEKRKKKKRKKKKKKATTV